MFWYSEALQGKEKFGDQLKNTLGKEPIKMSEKSYLQAEKVSFDLSKGKFGPSGKKGTRYEEDGYQVTRTAPGRRRVVIL
jgi:hypothetical protein